MLKLDPKIRYTSDEVILFFEIDFKWWMALRLSMILLYSYVINRFQWYFTIRLWVNTIRPL
jgi:hypothetical protein